MAAHDARELARSVFEAAGGTAGLTALVVKAAKWLALKKDGQPATPDPCKEDLKEARAEVDRLEAKLAAREVAHDADRERWIARCEQAEMMSRNNAVIANAAQIERDRLRADVRGLLRWRDVVVRWLAVVLPVLRAGRPDYPGPPDPPDVPLPPASEGALERTP